MSKLEVDAIEPQSGTTITIGAAGDTVNLVGTLQTNGSALPGDISSVVAGTGLSGGGTTGAVTINIDSAQPTITSLGTITSFRSTGIDDNSNALAMTIDSSENVGIKNTTMASFSNLPATDLVVGAGSTNSGITIYSGTSSGSNIAFADGASGDARNQGIIQYHHNGDYMRFFTSASEKMRILSDGSVGIGLSVPEEKFHVNGIVKSLGAKVKSVTTQADLRLQNSTTGGGATDGLLIQATGNDVYINNYENASMFFRTSNTDRMTITGAGNVGIGTTSPSTKLHVVGDYGSTLLSGTSPKITVQHSGGTNQFVEIQQSGGASFIGTQNGSNDGELYIIGRHTGNNQAKFSPPNVQLYTGNTERMRIHSNGVISSVNGIALGVGTANTASNVLDDYEEGTWTPAYRGASSAGSYSTNASGTYTKVGNLVSVTAHLKNITQNSAGSGSIQIAGLPFAKTSSQESDIGSIYLNLFSLGGSDKYAIVNVNPSASVVLITAVDSDGASASTLQLSARQSDSADMFFSITYTT